MSDGGSTPDQYALPKGAEELQDLIEHRDMNFAVGNIFKACYRIGTKNDDLYEANKICWFSERERMRILSQSEPCSELSINRLIEAAAGKCMEATATGEKSAVIHAVDLLGEAYLKMIELEQGDV